MRLADAIYSARISRGWGQKDLAAAAKCSEALVRRLENEGLPSVSQSKRLQIALALGIEYDIATQSVLSKHKLLPRRVKEPVLRVTLPVDVAEHVRLLAEWRKSTPADVAVALIRQVLQQDPAEIKGEPEVDPLGSKAADPAGGGSGQRRRRKHPTPAGRKK